MSNEPMDFLKVESVERQPLNFRIYENLKTAIIKGDLPQGSRLTETEVAKQMNVSATPVREAFRRLSAEGWVKVEPWKGAVVQSFTEQEIFEAYQCREALEVLACRLAIENMDDKGIKQLRHLLEQSEKAESVPVLVEKNSEIHLLILDYARNSKLKGLLGLVSDIIYRDRNISAYNTDRRHQIHAEHIEIVDALEARDAARAERAMQVHIRNGLNYIIREKTRTVEDSKG